MPAVGFVKGLYNATFIASLMGLPSHLVPLSPASAQFDSLLATTANMPPAAPPPGVGGDGNYTGLTLAPYKALSSTCSWMDASIVGTPIDVTLPNDRLYEMYEQVRAAARLAAHIFFTSLMIGQHAMPTSTPPPPPNHRWQFILTSVRARRVPQRAHR